MRNVLRLCHTASMSLLAVAAIGLQTVVCHAAQIDSVTVVTTTGEPYSETAILAKIQSVRGAEFDPDVLSEDLQRLHKSGFVSDVEAKVTDVADGAVAIRFIVEPVPRVNQVIIEGNSKIKTRALRKKIGTASGELLDRKKVSVDALAVRELYDKRGYYGTKVTALERPVPGTAEVQVVFRIEEERRVKVRRVDFVGNASHKTRALRRRLRTRHSLWSHIFSTGYFSEEKFAEDQLRLGMLYADDGFLDFQITDVKREYSSNGKWVRLTVNVDEGQPYTLGRVGVTGSQLFGPDELNVLVGSTLGEQYSLSQQEADVKAIEGKYRPLGYLDMSCRPMLRRDGTTHTVDINYAVTEGVPSRVRDIYISGNTVTQDEVIRRELRILPGDLTDSNKIDASKQVLANLNYFETVVVTPRSTEREDEKDIEVTVTEKRTGQLMLGAGISSEDAVVGTVEVTQTNFDWRNWPRFTGGGQRMRLRLQFGTERDDYLLSFVEPWWLDRRLRLELDAFRSNRDQDQYWQDTTGASVGVSRRWRTFWRQSVGLRVQQVDLNEFDDNLSAALLAEEDSYFVTALLFSVARDTRDRFVNPTKGSRLQFRSEFEPEFLGTYSNIYRLELRGTKYIPVLPKTVLRLRGELGVIDEVSGDAPAIFERYFAGGGTSFRGFDRREISPVDENEDALGGQSMLLGTVEAIHAFNETVRASVFTDVGNVWGDAYDWDPADVNVSIGIGLQLDLAIGPIRIDYGFPIVRQEEHLDSGGRLHFNLGYYF